MDDYYVITIENRQKCTLNWFQRLFHKHQWSEWKFFPAFGCDEAFSERHCWCGVVQQRCDSRETDVTEI